MNDFTMVTHWFAKPISIFPISDVHYGAVNHLEREWDEFCRMVLNSPDTYLVLGGDLINNNLKTSPGSVFEDPVRPQEQKKRMTEMLMPLRDRILCACGGNHEARSKDADVDLTRDIMCKLDIEDRYRENAVFMKVSIGERKRSGSPVQSYTFAVTHGTSLNNCERFGNAIDGLDVLVVGHTHKGVVSRPSKLVIDRRNSVVTMRDYTIVSMVSWLNYGGYALRKMLPPAQVAHPQKINLIATENQKKLEVVW